MVPAMPVAPAALRKGAHGSSGAINRLSLTAPLLVYYSSLYCSGSSLVPTVPAARSCGAGGASGRGATAPAAASGQHATLFNQICQLGAPNASRLRISGAQINHSGSQDHHFGPLLAPLGHLLLEFCPRILRKPISRGSRKS